jgi:hypothetical protein
MIVQEHLDDGLVRTYSNAGFKVHGGFPEADYDIVYDPEDANRQYVETNIPVDGPVQGPTQYSKLKILLAAQNAGFADALISFIEGNKMVELIWNASNTIEDNALLGQYISAISQAIGKTEEEIKAFLDEYCIADL